jgi:hypothetical protein
VGQLDEARAALDRLKELHRATQRKDELPKRNVAQKYNDQRPLRGRHFVAETQ